MFAGALVFAFVLGTVFFGMLHPDRLFRAGWTALAIGLVLAALMVWFWCRRVILPRVTFDREAGLLTLGWGGLRGRRPLSSVIGVQVMQTQKRFGSPELNLPAVTMYQLNLILDDPAERRLNVTTGDQRTAQTNARLIADFLDVPILDSTGTIASVAEAGAVEPTPMPPGFSTIPSPVVTEPGPDILLIRPRRLALLLGFNWIWLACMALPLIGLAAQGVRADWPSAVGLGALECVALVGLLHKLGRRARFDREQGMLTLGWLGRRTPRPLASVKAVQVVEGTQCQLNLLLEDAHQPRLNLMAETEPAVVRQAAERVASFLGVPLVEAKRQVPPAVRPGTGQAVDHLEELNRSPLPAGRASIRGPARAVPIGDDGLVLRARRRVNWVQFGPALATTGLGFYLVWLTWLAPAAGQRGLVQSAAWLPFVLFGPLLLLRGLKPLFLYRDRFDRQTGLLTLGWFGLKGTHSLAKVLAVQLVPGGLVDKGLAPFRRGGERVSYQMNLVIADTYQDRLNLTDDSDLEWTRQAGQQLADFLGVPVIDQIADAG